MFVVVRLAVVVALGVAACGGDPRPSAPPVDPGRGTGGAPVPPPAEAPPEAGPSAPIPDASPPGTGGGSPGTGGVAPGTGGAPAPAPPDAAPPPACSACASWGTPELTGRITTPGLDALSGLAASWRNPGIVYVHNDRDRPEVSAFTEDARAVAKLTFTGAVVRDLEDVQVGRCPAGTCLYLADIGNNISPRAELAIYRAPEPALAAGGPVTLDLAPERFAFRYADQAAHNAESILIDPGSGAIYVITKVAAGQPSAIYHLATFDPGRVNVAAKVADLPVPAAADQPATAASAHPCGAGFLLRTNNTLYEFRVPAGSPLTQAFRVAPVAVPVASERQGEAVSYRADGRAYYTTSEGPTPPINRVACR